MFQQKGFAFRVASYQRGHQLSTHCSGRRPRARVADVAPPKTTMATKGPYDQASFNPLLTKMTYKAPKAMSLQAFKVNNPHLSTRISLSPKFNLPRPPRRVGHAATVPPLFPSSSSRSNKCLTKQRCLMRRRGPLTAQPESKPSQVQIVRASRLAHSRARVVVCSSLLGPDRLSPVTYRWHC